MDAIELVVVFVSIPVIILITNSTTKKVDNEIRKYYFMGLWLKIIGAVSLGLIYQFYYGDGDTFAYFRASKVINSSISNSISDWLTLMFGKEKDPSVLHYTSRMSRYTGGPELFLVRCTSAIGLVTFNSYYGISLFFALFSFAGSWCMYRVLIRRYPDLKTTMAIAVFLIPSVVFWGSGLMKDTIVLGSMGFILYGIELLYRRKWWKGLFFLLLSIWMLTSIREFMLPALVLPVVVVLFLKYTLRIKQWLLRILATIAGLITTFVVFISFSGAFFARLKDFAEEALTSARYLYRVSILKDGSAYHLGKLDGSIESVLNLAPAAVWVSLFRPYVWESNNVVMLLTALESLAFLVGFVMVVFKTRITGMFRIIAKDSFLQYALVFTVFFAFVVGITTFNFGSLARYRIPILPFFSASLLIIWYRTGKYARK